MLGMCVTAAGISFLTCLAAGMLLIPVLRRMRVGQTVREEGPQTHIRKNGTPTMGGILILTSMAGTSLLFVRQYPKMIPVLFLTIGFGMVGFLDDYIKIVLRRSMGLSVVEKLICQLLITALYAGYLKHYTDSAFLLRIPFTTRQTDFGIYQIPVLFFITIATVNGTNFTDGLDGLAAGVTLIVATFFTVIAMGEHSGIEPVTCAVAGALLGFLVFNVHPASVFMGDTGSLALGGFVVSASYALHLPLFIPIVGVVYFTEVLSVILQVGFYRLTHGRRLFKMAPLHHHFELLGWSEAKITAVFTILTAMACLIALTGL